MPLTHSTPFDKFVKEYLNTWAVQHVPVVGYRIIRVYDQVSFQGFLGLKIIRFFYHFSSSFSGIGSNPCHAYLLEKECSECVGVTACPHQPPQGGQPGVNGTLNQPGGQQCFLVHFSLHGKWGGGVQQQKDVTQQADMTACVHNRGALAGPFCAHALQRMA
jgi:hypothetical protein